MFYIWARPHADGRRSQHCLQLLLSGCYPALTSYDSRNWTALHRAASFGRVEDIQLLLRNGANPLATINGWTPVFYAVCRKNHLVIPKLVEAGLDINYQDGGGWTLLHLAARRRSKLLLTCLFKLGANPHIKGAPSDLYWKQYHEKSQLIGEGERCVTPIDLARSYGEEYYKIFLLAAQEAGIDISWDSDGDAFWPAEENLSIRY
jgi:ankyrin repeat protein